MNEIILYVLIFIGGFILGIIFFGGLWLTVKKGVKSKIPAVLFVLSSLIRTAILLLVFYYLIRYDWVFSIFCLIGFILGRYIMVRKIRTLNKPVQLNVNS